jgi:hypothetical protein
MLIKSGADAFVSKSDPPDWVLETMLSFESRVPELNGDVSSSYHKAA